MGKGHHEVRASLPERGRSKWARLWFGATALCVVAGVALSVYPAVQGPAYFSTGIQRASTPSPSSRSNPISPSEGRPCSSL